jgi:hypothetical protein
MHKAVGSLGVIVTPAKRTAPQPHTIDPAELAEQVRGVIYGGTPAEVRTLAAGLLKGDLHLFMHTLLDGFVEVDDLVDERR